MINIERINKLTFQLIQKLKKREEGNVTMFGRIYFASFDALIF